MSRGIYDNWERLVRATVKREQYYELCRAESRSPSISSISSHFSSFDNHSLISSIMADQPSPKSSTFQPSAYEPLLRIRDVMADGRHLAQPHSTCIGVKHTRNHPKNNLKRFNIYKFKFSLFSLKARKSSQSSTNQKKTEEEQLLRSTDLSHSAQHITPSLDVRDADLLNKVEPPKAAGLNGARSFNSSSPWKTPHRKSFFDSGDIFPESRNRVPNQSTARLGINRLKTRGLDEPLKDLETLRQILEASQLKGLHSRKPSEKTQVSNRNFVYDESPIVVMKPSRLSTDISCDLEDETWSPVVSLIGSKPDEISSQDCDYVYISDILRASCYLPEDSDIFLLLEKQQYLEGKDTSKVSELQRKLIFDITNEILDGNKRLPPWKTNHNVTKPFLDSFWSEFLRLRERESSDDLFESICGVLKKDLAGDAINGWGDCHVEMSEAIMEIELMIFTDLISEAIRDLRYMYFIRGSFGWG